MATTVKSFKESETIVLSPKLMNFYITKKSLIPTTDDAQSC